jgi:hypothetical protein
VIDVFVFSDLIIYENRVNASINGAENGLNTTRTHLIPPPDHLNYAFKYQRTYDMKYSGGKSIGASAPNRPPNSVFGGRDDFGLTPMAPKRGQRVLESNKSADAPMPVPRRQEPIGSTEASHHVGFHQTKRLRPTWQIQTAGPSRLTGLRS